MAHPVIPKNQSSNLTGLVKDLHSNLAALQPNSSEVSDSAKQTTQIITYALIATAVVGIMVYHYIKEKELEANG